MQLRAASLVLLVLLGCVDKPRIYNGTAATEPHHQAVVSLHQKGSTNIFCSGTLISKSVVLTAAHCLDPAPSPSSLWVYVGDNATTDKAPKFYDVSKVVVHPGYDADKLVNDIAMLKLVSQVSIEPVLALPKDLAFLDSGEQVNFAGFGKTERGTYDQKLQVNGRAAVDKGDATQLFYVQEAGGPCFGDSGGPAFVERAGKKYVAGVTSYGDSACTAYGVSTRVDSFGGFIAQLIPPEPSPLPVPVPGKADAGSFPQTPSSSHPAVCGDGVCELGETCAACAADCFRINPKTKAKVCCGDGRCTAMEDAARCSLDCRRR